MVEPAVMTISSCIKSCLENLGLSHPIGEQIEIDCSKEYTEQDRSFGILWEAKQQVRYGNSDRREDRQEVPVSGKRNQESRGYSCNPQQQNQVHCFSPL